jgi:outer membrane cobalamin receptor
VEYWSRRNVDLAGAATLGDVVLVGVGASTHAIARTVLSFEVANLFNTAYEWWGGYIAPGRQLMLNAKVNLK